MSGGNNNPVRTNPVNTSVTLTVDTVNIGETNKKDKVTFSDDQGDVGETPGHPDVYTSTVNKGKQITWNGVPLSGSSVINITAVAKKSVNGGADVLASIGPAVPNRAGSTVKGIVASSQVVGTESYNITFNIDGDATKTFTIDPKLQMR